MCWIDGKSSHPAGGKSFEKLSLLPVRSPSIVLRLSDQDKIEIRREDAEARGGIECPIRKKKAMNERPVNR